MAYYIIETVDQLANLPASERCFIDLVAKSDDLHPTLTSPSVIYYNNFEKGYILVLDHSEGFSLPVADVEAFLQKHDRIYLLNAKKHSYYLNLPNVVDVLHTVLEVEGVIKDYTCETLFHRDFNYKHRYLPNLNTIIPICKHYERCECMFEAVQQYLGKETNITWLNTYTDVYKWVEEQGLSINEKVFDKHYELTWKANSVHAGKVYTCYNLYNQTSRPTNSFNGLNYLALPKDKSRAAFVPSNDFFVDFDFDGYHPRLIANLLNVEIPTDKSIHAFLGEYYFGKEELTDEEYQQSKKITFRQLYNGVEDEVASIQLFDYVDGFVKGMWKIYQEKGYINLPNGRKLVQDKPNPQKLFNYLIS